MSSAFRSAVKRAVVAPTLLAVFLQLSVQAGGAISARGLSALFVALALDAASASTAHASELDQFQNARAAYDSLNYELSVDLFVGLLAEASPGDTRPLVIESRKYLAASYLFIGRVADAERELRLLLEVEPDYVLDPLGFPAEVQRLFTRIKSELAEKRANDAARKERLEAERRLAHERATAVQRERLARLIELARTERTIERRSRWIALIPFGAGQYQNGNPELGLVLAITEGLLLASSITAFAFHENLRGQIPADNRRDDARLAEAAFRYANQISFGLFAAVAVTGIVDAQVRFKGTRTLELQRPLPRDLQDLDPPKSVTPAAASPFGLRISGTF